MINIKDLMTCLLEGKMSRLVNQQVCISKRKETERQHRLFKLHEFINIFMKCKKKFETYKKNEE